MAKAQKTKPKYPGIRVTTNGNELVSSHTEARLSEAGVFYPITPSTEMGELYQLSFAKGELNVFGRAKIAIEAEGEHAAQGGAIAISITGKRVVNFTSGQGIVYGCEQYYHAPGKLCTMVLQVASRTLTKSALNVHCGHDDVYSVLDTGWTMLFAKDAQQAADQSLILRKVTELSLNPGINVQDGFLTSHLERTFLKLEGDLIREFIGSPDDTIKCPTKAQRELFGPTRRRIPENMHIKNPVVMGPVQNQEHYMNGVIARRDNFVEPILGFLEDAFQEFGELTGRYYGLVSQYNCENAETVFVSLGSSSENIEAVIDYIKETRNEEVGAIHINVIRPFPEKAVINALKGKKNVIILERIDDQLAGDNPLARDIRTALSKAHANSSNNAHEGLPALECSEIPRIFSGTYGLGSRDFRPEGIIAAYEFAIGKATRQDGKKASDGTSQFFVGVNHPYSVKSSDETPSCLPENSIAIRFHSIGGWGAITTGKNLGEIIGEISMFVAGRDKLFDENGNKKEVFHISANPKYGSEKKGAPTAYFLVAAPERVRVNCDLNHVDVVLCCDPKAFTHTNPLVGIKDGGALLIESQETESERLWERIPKQYRADILKRNIRIFGLNGFQIAFEATDRTDLQFRMQGNAFLGAFFAVSSMLKDHNIPNEGFLEIVEAQYNKKFGRFGKTVVDSNMVVMKQGFEKVWEVKKGAVDVPDRSSMRGDALLPVSGATRFDDEKNTQPDKAPLYTLKKYDGEFRSDLGYHQPASPLASTGIMASATAATASKYVARRMVPIFYPENCTQCMDCIISCPDTALPNTAQDIADVLKSTIKNYVSNREARDLLLGKIVELDDSIRTKMMEVVKAKLDTPFSVIVVEEINTLVQASDSNLSHPEMKNAIQEIDAILIKTPIAYSKARPIFEIPEKKNKGAGGIFTIMVADICKGCGECVTECGDKNALKMELETEEINALHTTQVRFLDLLGETKQKFLGKYNASDPTESKAVALQNHLLVRSNYEAIVSGDGACAGCGEKSVLRAVSSITEAYMRPLYHAKADRLRGKVKQVEAVGETNLRNLKKNDEESYKWWSLTLKHIVLGLGGENDEDSINRIQKGFQGSDKDLLTAINKSLSKDAFNHRDIQVVDERYSNGVSVMMMSSCTGCNSVYGSTHPNNPHSYPWMNSLFQDAATLAWLWGEALIIDHAKLSVVPERLVDYLLDTQGKKFTEDDYFDYTHMTDTQMTDLEVMELPKAWAVGGDGAMGDIGFQNLSKVILQNRPNVMVLLLDTQVYSNTGGQNSDSSVMLGGFDMNQHGQATEGKLTERKEVAQLLMYGHGSPYIGQISLANAANMFQTILDSLVYRGTGYIQAFTSCQPEHGIGDDVSSVQARIVRDSRGMPEFVFDPNRGENFDEALSLKGNPNLSRDWCQKTIPGSKEKYNYTVAHWATTENRFRKHFFKVKLGEEKGLIFLDDIIKKVTQKDIVNRRYLNEGHRSFIPLKGVYILVEKGDKMVPMGISRQLVLFTVERRKNWRMLQSMVQIENTDYKEQKDYLVSLGS